MKIDVRPGRFRDTGFVGLCVCCLLGIAGLAAASPAAAASPPKCHGEKATIWSKRDVTGTYKGTRGKDVIVTGKGDDTIYGFRGHDVVCSHGGNDTIFGGPGWDKIYSGSGDDFAAGAHGNDVICAYAGRDAVFGGQGDDWLSTGPGVNYYDGDGPGDLNDQTYRYWVGDGYTYSVGIGSNGDDVMTGGMIHLAGATLKKRWRC